MMVVFKYLPWLLTCASLFCSCYGQDRMVTILNKLGQFEKYLIDNKVDMLAVEKRILNTIHVSRESFTTELKESIRDEVRKAMAGSVQGGFRIDFEMRHLKQGYNRMKRQLHRISKLVKGLQNETIIFHNSIIKKANEWNQENTCDICVKDKHRLALKLQKCVDTTVSLKADIKRCSTLKDMCQLKLITNITAPVSTDPPLNATSTSRTFVSATTPRPEEDKDRILIAPVWSSKLQQFHQLNIHNNSLSVYSYHNMKEVTALAYIVKTNKLLIALAYPHKIVSSTPDTRHVTVFKEDVLAYGIAVDEDQGIVFIATFDPRMSISRMSSRGNNFSAIINFFLQGYGWYSKHITLDTRRKRIYGCNNDKTLFTVRYDGQGMALFDAGSDVYAVTLDQTAGVLYYNIQMKLMKMNVSNNVSTEVATLDAVPWNMRLYRGTIYYSGGGSPIVGEIS